MIKRSLVVLALAGVAGVALAQTPPGPHPAQHWGRHARAMRMQRMEQWQMHRLTVLLDLNSTQQRQVKTILQEQHSAMRASMQKVMEAMREARQARRAAHKEMMGKLTHILNAGQMAKFKVLMPSHPWKRWRHWGPHPMKGHHGMGMAGHAPQGH